MSSINLDSIVQDEDGNETEMIQTIAAKKGIDLDTWLDANNYYQSSPKMIKRAIRKFLYEDWRSLSGYDWKLIRQFRKEFKAPA